MMDITVCIVDDTKDIRSALEQIVTDVGKDTGYWEAVQRLKKPW